MVVCLLCRSSQLVSHFHGIKLTVGREGSRMGSMRLVVAAAKIMAVQRKRWIRTGAAWAI